MVFSHKIRRVLTQPMMMAMAVLCSLVELIAYQFATGFVSVAGAAFFGGAYFGFILSTGFNYVNNLAPQGLKATAISLYSIGGPVAGVIVNFIGGQIITYQGIRTLYLFAAACMVLWLVVFVLSYYFGEKVLKKPAPMPLFRRV